jgi:hypothetical protein
MVKGILVTCIPSPDTYDTGDCMALVKRGPDRKEFAVTLAGVVSETASAGGVFYALDMKGRPARFSVIVYTD